MVKLTIYLPNLVNVSLSYIMNQTKTSRSELIRQAVVLYAKQPHKKIISKAEQSILRDESYRISKEFARCNYLLKNSHHRIMDMAFNSIRLTQEINMKVINSYINLVEKTFETFEPELKKDYKREMEVLQSYRRKTVLMIRLQPRLKAVNWLPPKSA